MDEDHPARSAARLSRSAVERKAREEWLALFAENAVIEDPVGVSALDPAGKGHRGKEAIAAFWDTNIAPNAFKFDIRYSYAAGLEVANTGTVTTILPGGTTVTIEGTFIYGVNSKGKLVSLRGFWEADRVQVGRL